MTKTGEHTENRARKEKNEIEKPKRANLEAEKKHQEPEKWRTDSNSKDKRRDTRAAKSEKKLFDPRSGETRANVEGLERRIQKKAVLMSHANGRPENAVLAESKKINQKIRSVNSGANHVIWARKLWKFQLHRNAAKNESANWRDYFEIPRYNVRVQGQSFRLSGSGHAIQSRDDRGGQKCASIWDERRVTQRKLVQITWSAKELGSGKAWVRK